MGNMTRLLMAVVLIGFLCLPVGAESFSAPVVPESGREMMPDTTDDLGKGFLELLEKAYIRIRPDLAEAWKLGMGIIAVGVLMGLLRTVSDSAKAASALAGTVFASLLLLSPTNAMIRLGSETVNVLSSYGKLLIPVMTGALAAQGGVTASAALYTGTAVFDALLTGLISDFLMPLVYFYLSMVIADNALGDDTLKRIRDMVKGFITWSLKTILIVFTAYMGITGVVSGTTDAVTLKAAKLTISTVVPVVGGILSDASESVLVSVGILKNAAGIYGILAAAAVILAPFLKIGAHYLILKAAALVCSLLDPKGIGGLVEGFSCAMGLILAMTGATCVLLLISIVCFLKGVS